MFDFEKAADNELEMMIKIRRELHMHPEVDRNLPFTSRLVENYLKELDITYKRYENNGIIAEFGSLDKSNNVVALRADMDALEVNDMKDVPYKSQIQGVMHACGHDAHTSILIGAASILKKLEQNLSGRVRLVFQPAEETDGGARDMIGFGALEGVKAIMGLHVDETLDTGTIGVIKGIVAAASNPFKINIMGKGSHGASPQDGVDSIYIAAKIIENLQGIISREISATESAVISIGKISGGTAVNAICDSVTIQGILRTLGKELRSFSKERMQTIVDSTAKMYRGEATIDFIESYPSYENNTFLYEQFNKIVKENCNINIVDIAKPSMGVEDFAYYTQYVPGFYYRLGCRNIDKGIINPAHGSYFDIDENCLKYGAMLQSMCTFELLKNNIK